MCAVAVYRTALKLWHILMPVLCFAAFPAAAQPLESLRVQMVWSHQSEFAGLYAAQTKDYYAREGLEVLDFEGGPGISPLQLLAKGEVDIAEIHLPGALAARQSGLDIVNIAQIMQHSSMALVCVKAAGIRNPPDIKGKTIGVWWLGDELGLQALLAGAGIGRDEVLLQDQAPDGLDLIEGRQDCGVVMMYNEYWSLLHNGFSPADLLVMPFDEGRYGFLENGYYVLAERLEDPAFVARLEGFLRATAAGWAYAREHREDALAMVMAKAPGLDILRQERMLDTTLEAIGTGPFGLLHLSELEHSLSILEPNEDDKAAFHRAAKGVWTHRIWSAAGLDPIEDRPLSRATAYHLSQAVSTQWFYILDLIGTVAFGLAGFMRAQQRRYDLWGAFILTMLPAVAGGTLRDLLVAGDRHPPFIFKDPAYISLVIGIVVVGTLASKLLPKGSDRSAAFSRWLVFFDTIGMATFTVIGAKVALLAGLSWYWAAFARR